MINLVINDQTKLQWHYSLATQYNNGDDKLKHTVVTMVITDTSNTINMVMNIKLYYTRGVYNDNDFSHMGCAKSA